MPSTPAGKLTERADNRLAALITEPDRPYILPGIYPGRLGVITAVGGASKSFMTLVACVQISAGLPVLGGLWGPAVPGGRPVVFISREDDIIDLETRLYSICQHLQLTSGPAFEAYCHNLVVCNARYLEPTLDYGIILPEDANGQEIPPVLVVIDTLSRFLPPGTNENDAIQMTGFFESIEDKLRDWGAGGLLIHHTNKAGMQAARDDLDAAGTERGSVAISFAARTAWSVRKPSQQRAAKHGISEEQRSHYVILEQTKINLGMMHDPLWFRKNSAGVPVPIPTPAQTATRPAANRPRIGGVLDDPSTDTARS